MGGSVIGGSTVVSMVTGREAVNSAIDMLGAETFWENANMKKGEVESFVGKM